MKLPVSFIQLPLRFDAARLAEEIGRFESGLWRAHPDGIPGNSALPLAAVDGDPARGDALQGPMRPTPALTRSPYMQQVLASLETVLGRIRLMRLADHGEVSQHVDTNHYWNERVRVHVPILTRPEVRFQCAEHEVNMAAGDCWIFDTWRMHRVINDTDQPRVHLVIDTVGSPQFWKLVQAGRPYGAEPPGWAPRRIEPHAGPTPELVFERVNLMSPMSFWELRAHVQFLLGEARRHANMPRIATLASAFVGEWQALWYRWGDAAEGQADYRRALDRFLQQMQHLGSEVPLDNGVSLAVAAAGLLGRAVVRNGADGLSEEASRAATVTAPGPRELRFDRPAFIVSPPRSGSTLLFEALARAPGLYTIGGEGHAVVEGIAGLDPAARGHDSNRLLAADASAAVAAELRLGYARRLADRERRRPQTQAVRMLEKTPKNALRIPFLCAVFPDARFIYLHRDPPAVLGSMLEAWESGGFRTYPDLPGWSGPPWSLLLVPGWRDLIGQSLAEIVAAQWAATTSCILDDLESLPGERVCVARYDALLADPESELERLAAALGLGWDRPLRGPLPLANHTVSRPQPDKWRRREEEILGALEKVAEVAERARRFVEVRQPAN